MRSREFAAIPLVLGLLGFIGLLILAVYVGAWAWFLFAAFTVVAVVYLLWWFSNRRPSRDDAPAPAPRIDDGAFRALVVADESCGAESLQQELSARASGRPIHVLVIAPALSSRLDRLTGDEQAYQTAQGHLNATLEALGRAGVDAEGRVGSHDPIQAADDGLREFPADLVVFATRPRDTANELERGLAEIAGERYDVPVTQIAGTAEGSA
jgi:hypothetical protein